MKNYLFSFIALLVMSMAQAQNLGINATGTAPDASAILDVSSTTKGMLIPRMTTLQRTDIASPATGLLVYDTDTQSFWFRNNTVWANLIGSSSGWSLQGNNAGVDDFIGTTNNQSLLFKANNQQAGKIDLLLNNAFWGNGAGLANTTGWSNTANGTSSLSENSTGNENTANGFSSLQNNTTGNDNTASGAYSLKENTTGIENTANGAWALQYNTIGFSNTAIGSGALTINTSGFYNTAIGGGALNRNTTGAKNTANGVNALNKNTTGNVNTANGQDALFYNTTGSYNTANGETALHYNTEGSYNTANGSNALLNNTLGTNNTAIGFESGNANITGNNNTFLGNQANVSADGFTNSTAIGGNAIVDASNKIRIGNAAVTVIEGSVAWSTPSDRRLKENVTVNNRLGLNFITQLQPVNYNYISDKSKVSHDGFIAQDIEKIIKKLDLPFSGLKKTDTGMYSIAYSDFVMPLVNAVKEQQNQIESLKKENEILKELAARVAALEETKPANSRHTSTEK
jgi:trimeric autotransporter adhesin